MNDLNDERNGGSIGLMVSAFTKKQSLTKQEIDEMYALLRELEVKNDD